MQVSELEGAELDYWVAKAEGFKITNASVPWRLMLHHPEAGFYVIDIGKPEDERSSGDYMPSKHWGIAGPIIEREGIDLEFHKERVLGTEEKWWEAYYRTETSHQCFSAESPLIAAMRAYVASKFGSRVNQE